MRVIPVRTDGHLRPSRGQKDTTLQIPAIIVALAQAATISAMPQSPLETFRTLEGSWQGKLEDRDYQSDRLERIPVEVEFEAIPNDRTFVQRSTFTDPAFSVPVTSLLAIDGETVYVASSRAERAFESYVQTARLGTVAGTNRWTLTLTLVDSDDRRRAVLREVMVRERDTLTITKEVDYLDDDRSEWVFRNRAILETK